MKKKKINYTIKDMSARFTLEGGVTVTYHRLPTGDCYICGDEVKVIPKVSMNLLRVYRDVYKIAGLRLPIITSVPFSIFSCTLVADGNDDDIYFVSSRTENKPAHVQIFYMDRYIFNGEIDIAMDKSRAFVDKVILKCKRYKNRRKKEYAKKVLK